MCDFDAVGMLNKRRATASSSELTIAQSYAVIREIDDARWNHQDSTGCTCWQEAIAAKPNMLAEVESKRTKVSANG